MKQTKDQQVNTTTAELIFPHQLWENHQLWNKNAVLFLVEEFLFFQQFNFHKIKLTWHRATMKFYEQYLVNQGFTVRYISSIPENNDTSNSIKSRKSGNSNNREGFNPIHTNPSSSEKTTFHPLSDVRNLIPYLHKQGFKTITAYDPTDDYLERRLRKQGCLLKTSPAFLTNNQEADDFFNQRKESNRYFQTDFYIWQRKKWNILIDNNGKPLGGKWTYDADNRKKIPAGTFIPPLPQPFKEQPHAHSISSHPKNQKTSDPAYQLHDLDLITEAIQYVDQNFSNNPGILPTPKDFPYPISFKKQREWLTEFLEKKFTWFGDYEDAIVQNESFLFHSVLTPMMNNGMLAPKFILEEALHYQDKVPLNALEGFIRQILGWREFMYQVYRREGRYQRTKNFWKFYKKIPDSFYTGSTGFTPVDDAIKKVLHTAYNHHIERLMILGNIMLLSEFHPDEIYRWFMEMYIDAYDWVMVPNVYGMSQFADGGKTTTKPYISGSNYIFKMSDYSEKNSSSWKETWDGLFWHFMFKQKDFFSSNPRLGMLLNTFQKMPQEKQNKHLQMAQKYLDQFS
jgi:deoxyribodipyrimidine photolyase-related protein